MRQVPCGICLFSEFKVPQTEAVLKADGGGGEDFNPQYLHNYMYIKIWCKKCHYPVPQYRVTDQPFRPNLKVAPLLLSFCSHLNI